MCYGRPGHGALGGVNSAPSPIKVAVTTKGVSVDRPRAAATAAVSTQPQQHTPVGATGTDTDTTQADVSPPPTRVTVVSVTDETPTVKVLRFRVDAARAEAGVAGPGLGITDQLKFKPGQWVDFFAPGVDKPGGFRCKPTNSELSTWNLKPAPAL
jgi:hypothetical protein